MRVYYTIEKVGKYKFKTLRIGMLKIELCIFKNKFMIRLNINNWDE